MTTETASPWGNIEFCLFWAYGPSIKSSLYYINYTSTFSSLPSQLNNAFTVDDLFNILSL